MNHATNLIIISLGVLLLCSCSKNEPVDNKSTLLARVGEHYLTLEEARLNIPSFMMEKDSTASLDSYRKKWIQRQLLLREARGLQLAENENVQRRISQAKEEVFAEALKQKVLDDFSDQLNVTEQELNNFIQKNEGQLTSGERFVQIRHLETTELANARTARQELENGTPWPQIARAYSLNPEKKIAEAKTFWAQQRALSNVPVMQRYVAQLDSSAISPIRRSEGVYQFIQVADSWVPGESPIPEWFTDDLKQWLIAEKKRDHYNSYLKNLYFQASENNEIELYNVLNTNDNSENTETNQPNE